MRFIVFLFALWNANAQATPPRLTFEVASIKRSALDVQGMFGPTTSGGSVRVVGATLKNLVSIAHDVRQFLISGGPPWSDSDRFDINARAEVSPDPDHAQLETLRKQMPKRLQSLLADRFQLAVHSESKEQSVYALVLAKNGPKFHEATAESKHMIRMQRGILTGNGVAMTLLVQNLSYAMSHQVIDKTGLKGLYDFKMEWAPDIAADTSQASDPGRPSLITALQEQLGLRLEQEKAPVKMLIIDHAERPSEN